MTYEQAFKHLQQYKEFYSIARVAKEIGIAPSLLRNAIDEKEVFNHRKFYKAKLAEHHHENLRKVVERLCTPLNE